MNTIQPLISIIVPVYKVEDYIDQCINSILHQSYKNWELILVDDGSPDTCGSICDDFATKDKRIKVIHKENGGLSDARNAGINIARGNYITFIDSDDYIHEDYLKDMIDIVLMYQADIVQVGYTNETSLLGNSSNLQEDMVIFKPEEALHDMLRLKSVQVNAWAKLYNRELFTTVRYPVGRINEDNLTTYKLILASKSPVICINRNLYFYRVNLEGIMHSQFNLKRYEVLSFSNEIIDYLGNNAAYFKSDIDYSEMRLAIRLYNECVQSGYNKQFFEEQKKIRTWLSGYNYTSQQCGFKYYIMLRILRKSWRIYNFFIKLLRS